MEGDFGVEAFAVVADANAQLVGIPGEADIDEGGFGVFNAVLKTFLDDTEEDELFVFGDGMFGAFGGDGDFEDAGPGDAKPFFFGRFANAEGADVFGVEAFGEVAEIADGAGQVFAGALQQLVVDGFGLTHAAELHLGQTEQLADIVMDLLADIGKGLFLHFETGLHKLLVKLRLHRLLLLRS